VLNRQRTAAAVVLALVLATTVVAGLAVANLLEGREGWPPLASPPDVPAQDDDGPPDASMGDAPDGDAPDGDAPDGDAPDDVRPRAVPDDAEPAIVDGVVDGDTLRVIAEPGGSIPSGGSIRVRLLNIDAPELARDGRPDDCGGPEARQRLADLVGSGDLVWMAADREDRDRFDRPLRAVWTHDGDFVNERLAGDGLVDAVLFAPNDRFHDRIEAAVATARTDGRGIWGPLCAPITRP
jgi:micrococcal nuclease